MENDFWPFRRWISFHPHEKHFVLYEKLVIGLKRTGKILTWCVAVCCLPANLPNYSNWQIKKEVIKKRPSLPDTPHFTNTYSQQHLHTNWRKKNYLSWVHWSLIAYETVCWFCFSLYKSNNPRPTFSNIPLSKSPHTHGSGSTVVVESVSDRGKCNFGPVWEKKIQKQAQFAMWVKNFIHKGKGRLELNRIDTELTCNKDEYFSLMP